MKYCILTFIYIVVIKQLNGQSYSFSPLKYPEQYLQVDQSKRTIVAKNFSGTQWHFEYVSENENDLRGLLVHDLTDKALDFQNGIFTLSEPNVESATQIWITKDTEKENIITIQHHRTKKYLSYMGQGLIMSDNLLETSKWKIKEENSNETEEQIENLDKLIIYTMSTCGRCKFTKEFLTKNKIPFQEYNTSKAENNNKMFDLIQATGKYKGGSVQMPVIIYQGKVNYNISNLETFLDKIKTESGSKSQSTPINTKNIEKSSGNLTQAQKDAFVNRHNFFRKEVGVPNIRWSESLANVAYEWAKHLADNNCEFKHRPDTGPFAVEYGENIAWSYVSDPVNSVNMWGAEKSKWKGGVVKNMESGHYTQVIWAKTTEVGCAIVKCSNGSYITVCNYNPAGNYIGRNPLEK